MHAFSAYVINTPLPELDKDMYISNYDIKGGGGSDEGVQVRCVTPRIVGAPRRAGEELPRQRGDRQTCVSTAEAAAIPTWFTRFVNLQH